MTAAVGADIESICGKCGDVWHVVVAMVGDRVAKVLCKQCGGQHRHRPPGGTTATSTPRKRATKAGTATTRARGQSQANEPLVKADPKRPVRTYAINETFCVGDRIDHSKFGSGVVELVVGPGKIQVFFPTGRRVMAHERPVW